MGWFQRLFGRVGPDGDDAVEEFRQGAANSLRKLGPIVLAPMVGALYVVELRAGKGDLALHAEVVTTLLGAALLLALREVPARRIGLVGTIWLAAVIVTAQAHYGLTAGLAAGWMAVAITGHVFFRWTGSLPTVALQLVMTLGTALGIRLGWWNSTDFTRYGVSDPAILVRMALVICCAMTAIVVAHEHLIDRLERWQRRVAEARDRQRQAELEHARAVAGMENLLRMESVGRLAAGVAHDVNDALTIIMGNAELMAWASREEADELRQEILTAATSASRTTSQLMSITRGALREEEEPVGRLVASLADLMRRLLPSDIQLEVQDTSAREIRVDSVRFQQVLLHLIANARDSITRSGEVTVSVTDAPDDDGVIVAVTDNGRGWDMDAVARAFDPPDERGPGLTTLGLGPARDLTVRYNGTVEIDSTPGAGTRILLHLGRRRRAFVETPRTAEAISASSVRQLPALEVLRGRHVLIAEDEEPVRRLILAYLKGSEATLTVVGTAIEARAAIVREPFDLFLTDAVMPGGGTMEAIEEFRRRNRRGRVLVVSGHVREDLIRRGIETGLVSYLPKPFSRVQLVDAIARSLRDVPSRPLVG